MSGEDRAVGGAGHTIEELSTASCWNLIESQAVGRIAMLDLGGDPEVFPVNHTVHEGRLYLRSARGDKLRHIRAHPNVAFEVDGGSGGEHWSVLMRGRAEEVTLDAEIRRSGVRAVQTASPTAKPFIVRIEATTITGRRFRESRAGDDPAIAGSSPAAEAATAQRVPGSARPHPIAHHRPLSG